MDAVRVMPCFIALRRTAYLSLATLLLALFQNGRCAVTAGPIPELKPEQIDFFERKIRPLLAEQCYECHSATSKKIKGGLLLDSRANLLKGGDSGPVIVPGQPEKTLLIKAVRYVDEDLQMPPKHRLTPEQVADLVAWIKMGAPDPRTGESEIRNPKSEIERFWSFQPVKDPKPPEVKTKRWPKNDVDRFILAKLEEKGLTPARDADKRTLIRRATFDLTGLPPTPQDVDAFLADKSPDAFGKVVDRLLASPHYGEQWGRHWLDVVRYADTSGCNSDYPVPTAYKYRNYVITAFNNDTPYDEFVCEQLAGDLLPGTTDDKKYQKIVATGYLAISRRFGSRASEFHLTIEDIIDNVGKTFLGLSVSCARCHDHKFDPIPNRDYYALYGIFNSTRYAFPGTEIYKHPKDFVPLAPESEAAKYYRDADELASLDDQIEKLLEEKKKFERIEKEAVAKVDDKKVEENRGALQAERKDKVKLPEFQSLVEVKAALDDARTRQRILENKTYPFEKAYAVAEGKPADARIQKKGDPKMPGDVVPRGFLEILGGQTLPETEKGSGRLELAQWISDPKNPLTARVMVNRIWQYHLGKGIVQTPNDFGTRGKPPAHPELLDYLATRFVESGWSVKAMHKLIMLSHAYQQSSVAADVRRLSSPATGAFGSPSLVTSAATKATEIDVNNDLLWRFNRRRLSAEEVRDSLLFLSGELDPAMGGPHQFPPENEWKYTQHKPFVALYPSKHRSVYLMQQRIRKHPFLETFDGPDPNATTAVRSVSTSPIQALFMMNDPLVHEAADRFAVRVGMALTDEAQRIHYAYQLAFARPASPEEIRIGQDYLRQCREAVKETELAFDQQPRAALASYMRVLFGSNEFMFVD